MNEERLPVTIYLPVESRTRRGMSSTHYYTVTIPKPVNFTVADFTPFALESDCEAWGYTRRWDLEIARLDVEKREIICKQLSLPYSKRGPLLEALTALGWTGCAATKVIEIHEPS